MLTGLWSVEHAHSRPATPSVLHRFRYLSVLSNAQDQYLSKSSLPHAQGVLYLSLLCPRPAVLRPCTHPSEFPNIFTSSWLKAASLAGISHPVIRIFGSFAKYYLDHFTFRCRRYEFVVRVFVNFFYHMYAISKHCYLFHHLSTPCPALLRVRMQRTFFLPHNFKARMQKISRNVFYSPINCLQTVAFNCFHLSWQRRRDSSCAAAWRFRLGCSKPSSFLERFPYSPCLNFERDTKPPVMCRVGVGHVGGGSPHGVSWASIESFSKSTPETFDVRSKLLYVAHVDAVAGLNNYPPDKYVYAAIPLISMVDMLSLVNVRAIAKLHGIAVGSRCNATSLKYYIGEHSCSNCTGFITVFSVEKNAAEKQVDRTVKSGTLYYKSFISGSQKSKRKNVSAVLQCPATL